MIVLSSCSTSTDVVNGSFFHKRKYNKGFSLNIKKQQKKQKQSNGEVLFQSIEVSEANIPPSTPLKIEKEILIEIEAPEVDMKSIEVKKTSFNLTASEIVISKKVTIPIEGKVLLKKLIRKDGKLDDDPDELKNEDSKYWWRMVRLGFGYVLAFFFLSPIGVAVGVGFTKNFWINLGAWATFLGLVFLFGNGAFLSVSVVLLILLLGMFTYIHALYALYDGFFKAEDDYMQTSDGDYVR